MSQNETTNQLAVMKRDVVDAVGDKVTKYVTGGELHLPSNYSVENAMKSAWLILQNTLDKDKHPVLQSCTKDSIANSLLDMAVQGLDPMKKQCYFIAYGDQLSCQRSYHGTMAVAKRVRPEIVDIVAEVVYEGDEFRYRIVHGRKTVVSHEQVIGNVDKSKIVAAYCEVLGEGDKVIYADIMTMDEIKAAWAMSKMYPIDDKGALKPNSTHGKFTAEMAKKTVIARTCKPIINSSDAEYLLRESVNRSSMAERQSAMREEIAENANRELLTAATTSDAVHEVVDETTGEVLEVAASEAAPAPNGSAKRGPSY